MTKVEITINYTTKMLERMSKFMVACELVDGLALEPYVIKFTTKTKVDKKYKDKLKKSLKEWLEKEDKEITIKNIKIQAYKLI